ncbi:MAG: SDR family NAD(P)-dependent oxidoreductase [Lachnospiraceae bacterium]|jgi:short-subunit dehydrogenase|nr:SDR family NAD(P)-dependent oxidoreductase [Lachnospiraceae bacterium]
MKAAIITGASSGMGREFVKLIDRKLTCIDEVWVIARRKERLEQLKERIEIPLVLMEMDLTDKEQRLRLREILKEKQPQVKMLVNCSGYGKIGLYEDIPEEDISGMIELNCLALTSVTYEVLPYMTKKSRIINLASSAAFLPQPKFAVYAATKSYVLSFSRALHEEVKKNGIFVTAVCPGPVRTEFFDIAQMTGEVAFYKKIMMANPAKVVEQALRDSLKGKTVSVYGGMMKAFRILCKVLPHEWLMKFIV